MVIVPRGDCAPGPHKSPESMYCSVMAPDVAHVLSLLRGAAGTGEGTNIGNKVSKIHVAYRRPLGRGYGDVSAQGINSTPNLAVAAFAKTHHTADDQRSGGGRGGDCPPAVSQRGINSGRDREAMTSMATVRESAGAIPASQATELLELRYTRTVNRGQENAAARACCQTSTALLSRLLSSSSTRACGVTDDCARLEARHPPTRAVL
ncbi:hypothetical protein CERZMDRAFT_85550 [Cercospora zeae-maydis SCOH1-5]|uniref:Uncharacterized protein n=1 Tax=Cercospora zeae-maydis SCOH1-5 TaxID=717836 RepID=A0A6A6FDC7_9PEZI|nr:hypothetical protein CERZMDRAFT_85550 [Cercospora zeae-maydis SCOH1-5]